jgi:hypothetical protein
MIAINKLCGCYSAAERQVIMKRYFWDTESCTIITEQKLRTDFDELKATDKEFSSMYSTFEHYVEACCGKSDSLQLLCKGPGQFNSDGGNDVGAVYQFSALLEAICGSNKPGCDVKIIVDGYMLEAYNHAALMQGLLDAVNYFAEEIS